MIFFYISLACYLLFAILLTIFALKLPNPQSLTCMLIEYGFRTKPNYTVHFVSYKNAFLPSCRVQCSEFHFMTIALTPYS